MVFIGNTMDRSTCTQKLDVSLGDERHTSDEKISNIHCPDQRNVNRMRDFYLCVTVLVEMATMIGADSDIRFCGKKSALSSASVPPASVPSPLLASLSLASLSPPSPSLLSPWLALLSPSLPAPCPAVLSPPSPSPLSRAGRCSSLGPCCPPDEKCSMSVH